MKIKFLFFLLAVISSAGQLSGQDSKVAVFDPAGNVDNAIKEIVREEINSSIVKTVGYTALERQQLIRAFEARRIQPGGLMDDSQACEIGSAAGANLVLVSSITKIGDNFHISCKLVNVQTVRIEMQRTVQTQRGTNDLISVVQKMASEMFGDIKYNGQTTPTAITQRTTVSVVEAPPILTVRGRIVHQESQELSKRQVRSLMINNDALRMYNKSLIRNGSGNFWITTGILSVAGGAVIAATQPFEVIHSYIDHHNNHYYEYRDEQFAYIVGGSIATAGVAMIITGALMKKSGLQMLKKSVDLHNTRRNRTNVEFDFGFTGNGVRFALNF